MCDFQRFRKQVSFLMKPISIICIVYLILMFVHNRCWVHFQCQLKPKSIASIKILYQEEEVSWGQRQRLRFSWTNSQNQKRKEGRKKESYSIVFQDLISGRQAMFSWSVLETNRDQARTNNWPSCWPSLNNGYSTDHTACSNASSEVTLAISETVSWARDSTTVYPLS